MGLPWWPPVPSLLRLCVSKNSSLRKENCQNCPHEMGLSMFLCVQTNMLVWIRDFRPYHLHKLTSATYIKHKSSFKKKFTWLRASTFKRLFTGLGASDFKKHFITWLGTPSKGILHNCQTINYPENTCPKLSYVHYWTIYKHYMPI